MLTHMRAAARRAARFAGAFCAGVAAVHDDQVELGASRATAAVFTTFVALGAALVGLPMSALAALWSLLARYVPGTTGHRERHLGLAADAALASVASLSPADADVPIRTADLPPGSRLRRVIRDASLAPVDPAGSMVRVSLVGVTDDTLLSADGVRTSTWSGVNTLAYDPSDTLLGDALAAAGGRSDVTVEIDHVHDRADGPSAYVRAVRCGDELLLDRPA